MKIRESDQGMVRLRQRGLAALGLLLVSSAAFSRADVGWAAQDSQQAATFRHLPDSARALSQLGGEVARLDIGEPSFVAVSPIALPPDLQQAVSATALETLRGEIRKNVASTVPFAKIQAEEALSPLEARTRARRAGLPLVLLETNIKAGDLFLHVTVTKWPRNFWRRALAPKGTTTGALRLRVRAESLRRLFPVAKTVAGKRWTTKSPVRAPVAVACGDIDEDGLPELAVVGRHSIVLGTLEAGSFRSKARRSWADLSDVHSAPLRSPLSAARIENQLLTVGLSDRSHTVHLDGRLEKVGFSARGYPLPGGSCLPFSPEGVVRQAFDCRVSKKVAPLPQTSSFDVAATVVDAYASSWFLTQSGVAGSVSTLLPLGESDVSVEVALPSEQLVELVLPGTGSALMTADLNGDGTVEIISSSDSAAGAPDRLRIHTLVGRHLVKAIDIQTSSISALAVCPFAGENPLTLVVATEEELWILK